MEITWLQIILGLIIAGLYMLYRNLTSSFDYWREKGIKYIKPYPIVGSLFKLITAQEHILDFNKKIYKKYRTEPYIGFYQGSVPALMVFDPALVKNIMVKDFQHFTDHGFKISEEADPLEAKNMFNLVGQRWKEMRAKLTPTFTSGKMKSMFPLVLECANQFEEHLDKMTGEEFEAKDMLSRYTTDVIGSCAFGIQCNSLKDPNCDFRVMGKRLTTLDSWKAIKTAVMIFLPEIAMRLKIAFFDEELTNFFRSLVKGVIDMRAKNNIKRKDFMQLLIEIKERGKIENDEHEDEKEQDEYSDIHAENVSDIKWTDDDVTAQATVFFFAGFETSSTLMSFALLELAKNPEVQEKAHKNIDEVLEKYDGEITYQSLQEMNYIDWVMNETMRKYPPVANHVRICTKNYKFPVSELAIDEGTMVYIPNHALQNDPKYFPEPEKFKPERFSNDETSQKNQYIFTPFGEGPRQCIGNRFALMQSKLGLLAVLRKFNVKTCSKTVYPVEFDPKQFILTTKNGAWVTVEPRT